MPPPATGATTVPATGVELKKFEFVQPKMGTVFRVTLWTADESTAASAGAAVFARVDALNAILSDYDPKSELSRLSLSTDDGPMKEPVPVSDDLWHVLDESLHAATLSEGAFDVTIGPLVRLWRRSRDMHELPSPQRVIEAKKAVGYQQVRLFPETHSVQLLGTKMRLDVGGIAKGYTSDQCVRLLRKMGLTHVLVGAAGDIAVGDPPPGHEHWRVAFQSLTEPDKIAGYVNLANWGISTSGDTYRVVEIDGKRYSHIIDPQTGVGMTRRIGVTTTAPDATTADWLATAVSVLGPDKGIPLADSIPNAAVRVIVLEDGQSRVYQSKRFAAFLAEPSTSERRSDIRYGEWRTLKPLVQDHPT